MNRDEVSRVDRILGLQQARRRRVWRHRDDDRFRNLDHRARRFDRFAKEGQPLTRFDPLTAPSIDHHELLLAHDHASVATKQHEGRVGVIGLVGGSEHS